MLETIARDTNIENGYYLRSRRRRSYYRILRASLFAFPALAKLFFKEVLLLESVSSFVKHEQNATVHTKRLPEYDDGCSNRKERQRELILIEASKHYAVPLFDPIDASRQEYGHERNRAEAYNVSVRFSFSEAGV